MTMGAAGADYDYIIRLIQYLDRRHGIRFFITSRDFDVLYRWWEKRIPEGLVRECLDRVVERGRRSSRPLSRFAQFSNEVRRGYDSFLALRVGSARAEPVDEHAATQAFLDAREAAGALRRRRRAERQDRLVPGQPRPAAAPARDRAPLPPELPYGKVRHSAPGLKVRFRDA